MYWSIDKSISYGCLFNFIVGARGVGKTYALKQFVIKDFLKTGNQFVYVRRYKEELKKIDRFFDDISMSFEGHKFLVKKPNFVIDGRIAGSAIPLSTSKIEKSTPFPNVKTIIFDEFILDKGYHHYLPDEVTNFLELYSTIARDRDVRVYFLSNALSQTNPYFIYFNLNLPYKKTISASNDILIENIKNEEYATHMKQTRFGKLISGTEYGNYAVDNSFLRDTYTFIKKKSGNCNHLFDFVYKGQEYGVWNNMGEGCLYVSYDTLPEHGRNYAFSLDDHTPNTQLLKNATEIIVKFFITKYKDGCVYFEGMNIKNMCNEIIKATL